MHRSMQWLIRSPHFREGETEAKTGRSPGCSSMAIAGFLSLYLTPDKTAIIADCNEHLHGIYTFQSSFSYIPFYT